MTAAIVWIAVLFGFASLLLADPSTTQAVGAANNAFGVTLYERLSQNPGNLFFSPTSIQTSLAMTMAGARGPTAEQMAKTICVENDAATHASLGAFLRRMNAAGKTGGFDLSVANALWLLKGYEFAPDYLSLVQKDYDARLDEVNFTSDPEGSRKTINDWVAGQTHDKIKNLMPAGTIDSNTRLVLTNAIYFKGKWDSPFNKRMTNDAPFTFSAGGTESIPFMRQVKRFRCAEDETVQLLELPYGQNTLAMRIFLPRQPEGLAAFEKDLGGERMDKLMNSLQSERVEVWLPRFKVESGIQLGDVLEAMGMTLAFDPQRADFHGMSSEEHLYISTVIHKAFVNVDEEGTEAAAATGIGMRTMAIRAESQPKLFKADHPFLFAIVDQQSGAMLFMGRVAKP
jgi:serpin B